MCWQISATLNGPACVRMKINECYLCVLCWIILVSIIIFFKENLALWKDDSAIPLLCRTYKRSLSDGNILCESDRTRDIDVSLHQYPSEETDNHCLSESSSDIFTCGSDLCHCRYAYLCILNAVNSIAALEHQSIDYRFSF